MNRYVMALGLAIAFAGTARAACDPKALGQTAGCPVFVAPSATAVPGPSMADAENVPANTTVSLFGGAIPPNGFMVAGAGIASGAFCSVNDDGPATNDDGFLLPFIGTTTEMGTFATPPGYKPIGPVSVFCNGGTRIEARGW
jgi:hypothetical protein